MEIDGMDFLDWVHKTRQESEEERRRRGVDEVARQQQLAVQARTLKKEFSRSSPPVARDRKAGQQPARLAASRPRKTGIATWMSLLPSPARL